MYLENGWKPDERSLAIACASHNGEPSHVAQVRSILAESSLGEESLQCPADVPAHAAARLNVTEPSPIYHYCSGKHSAMLATCAINGWPLNSYRDGDHPLQILVRERIQSFTGDNGQILVDGCGVPTFTAPLSGLAKAFKALDDGGPEMSAMRAHAFLVAGTGELDTDLMEVNPAIVSKYGAEGLACASAEGFGIALKPRDGVITRAREPAMLLVLHALGLIDSAQLGKLQQHAERPLLGGGIPVGRISARGALASA